MEKRFSVTIEPAGLVFETSESVSLMEAATLAGVDMPVSCRNGTCRTCLCQLNRGKVSYRIEWPGVSADEKKEGLILPCVAIAESDLSILAPYARRRPAP